MTNKAVFLDRDGVLNANVLNPATGEWESPHSPEDFRLFPWALESLKALRSAGLRLFLVSNQPSYAKGKTSLENIHAVHDRLAAALLAHNIDFQGFYYCYHHPSGRIPGYSGPCRCRKPSPFFLQEAARAHHLRMEASWMVGDRDADVLCGRSAGVRTIRVRAEETGPAATERADFEVHDLREAVQVILGEKQRRGDEQGGNHGIV